MRDDRERGLFSAVVAVAAGLELNSTLRRIVQAAVDLVDARYGALGVLGPDGNVSDFVHVGMDHSVVEAIGEPPQGRGMLGLLTRHPVPIRVEHLSQHPASVGFPANHPPMTSFLGVPVRVRGEVFGNLYLTDKRGDAAFTADDERNVMALAAAAAVAIENARLYERSRQRERWQQAVFDVAQAVLSGTDTEDVLSMITQRARSLTGADLAVLAMPDEQGRLTIELVDVAPSDQEPEGAAPSRFAARRRPERSSSFDGLPVAWLGAQVPRTSLVHTAFRYRSMIRQVNVNALSDGRQFGALVALPMASEGYVLGVLALLWDVDVPVVNRDVAALAESFAAQASLSLVLTRALREQERLAVYEDRDRIARDLHDLVIQRLFATGMHVQGTMRVLDNSELVEARLSKVVDELDETIREIRQTIFALHEPIEGPASGPRGRILRETAQAAALLGFEPAVRFVGPVDTMVSNSTADHLIAALREALTNAAKHAQAGRVDVVVEIEDGAVVLHVIDDGVGVSPQAGRRSGLANLNARASDLGGSSSLERVSEAGGTHLRWRVPLADA